MSKVELRPRRAPMRLLARQVAKPATSDGALRFAQVTAVDAAAGTVTVDMGTTVDGAGTHIDDVATARSYTDPTVGDVVVVAVIDDDLIALAAL